MLDWYTERALGLCVLSLGVAAHSANHSFRPRHHLFLYGVLLCSQLIRAIIFLHFQIMGTFLVLRWTRL